MRRFVGVITLGPLVWLLVRWLARQPSGWFRERLEVLDPRRLFDTRPHAGATPEIVVLPPGASPSPASPHAQPYEPPGPDDPESGETTLSPEGSPEAHRVVPN